MAEQQKNNSLCSPTLHNFNMKRYVWWDCIVNCFYAISIKQGNRVWMIAKNNSLCSPTLHIFNMKKYVQWGCGWKGEIK